MWSRACIRDSARVPGAVLECSSSQGTMFRFTSRHQIPSDILRAQSFSPAHRPASLAKMSTQRADTTSPRSSDAIVMGGGWAGLIAALRLTEGGNSVTLIEARPRLGGRAFTHTYTPETMGSAARTASDKYDSNVAAVDFGCSWIHGYAEGNPVKSICEKLEIVRRNDRFFPTAFVLLISLLHN